MGKKNRPMPNSSNNKDAILKRAAIDSLDKQLSEKKELVAEVQDWIARKAEKEAELQSLIEQVSLYGEAKEIVDRKELLLQQAKEEKTAIENEVETLKVSATSIREEIERYQKVIGVYETAEEIINSAEERSKTIIHDAEKVSEAKASEYDELLSGAETEKEKILGEAKVIARKMLDKAKQEGENAHINAESVVKSACDEAETVLALANEQAAEIINNANIQYKEALSQKDSILTSAQESAGIILSEAREKVEQYYSCKVAEGESQKTAVIEAANQERNRIISQAHMDAEMLSTNVRTQAEDYAKRIREKAESEADRIVGAAETVANHIAEEADKERNNARQYADLLKEKAFQETGRIKEQAYEAMVADRKALNDKLSHAAELQAEYEAKLKELERRSLVLDRREDSIDSEIADRVEKECEITKHRFDELQDFSNRIYRENKELNRLKEISLELQAKMIDRNTLDAQRQQLEELANKGITVDTADNYVRAFAELEKAEKQIEKLKIEKANMASALRQTSNNEDELNIEKDRNKFYVDTIKELTEELNKSKTVSRSGMIAPIMVAPAFMTSNELDDDRDIANEIEWLDHIQKQSKSSGLQFSKRQIYAYHTAQKIKDMSPLVVLAGVSGTGKSELPKNYAIHGGMNFLSIPVKPDWDSPASLFGYYNSIERRFEATDLVRALYQMSKDDVRQQQMMVVLLDEMNLAHPEQYFADLLSKLETCRGMSESAQYDILLGGGEAPERLDIGGNILWTGTMNEDETTKGLSDKVIDRSTLITFPRPKVLYDRKEIAEIKPSFVLSKKKWSSWCNDVRESDVINEKLFVYKDVVQSINEQMSGMGKNLGHRVWQGMAKYINHHPNVLYAKKEDDLQIALDKAFSDSLAFKVMPKLRGVETRGLNEDRLNNIEMILSAHASELVQDYNNARQLTTELFQWCSADFMNKDDE